MKAKDCFRKALELLPEDPVISYNLALELMIDENWRGGSQAAQTSSVSGEPDNPDFWCERGVVLYRLDRHEEAEESFDLALTYGDEDARIWNSHGESSVLSMKGMRMRNSSSGGLLNWTVPVRMPGSTWRILWRNWVTARVLKRPRRIYEKLAEEDDSQCEG